jgi:UDP-N-acetylmuramate dehydrogenase
MTIQSNVSLKPFHTFGMNVQARQLAAFQDQDSLGEILAAYPDGHRLILGGGSNVLFTRDYDGLVLKNEVKGIETIAEDDNYVYIKAGAGENWHGFVQHCIHADLGGVENLSLIPGCVGASPMQNIGAYGVEIKEVFQELEAYHLQDGVLQAFSLNDCNFGYRDSVFKNKFKDQFVILNVTFRLRRRPVFNTSYGAIEQELSRMGVKDLSVKAISDAVINIRRSKLPDPAKIGNAGSFFKNPVVPASKFAELSLAYPGMPAYPAEVAPYEDAPIDAPDRGAAEDVAGSVDAGDPSGVPMKLAAGWMIEQCGWKGYRKGDAGVHERQALVLVNYGNATGKEIFDLSQQVMDSVHQKFGVVLEREVNIC